jgi:hypothetical protein
MASQLTQTWLLLMALTVTAMISAQLEPQAPALPPWALAIVVLSAALKARQILMVYLDLQAATAGWRGFFTGLLITTLALIFAAYVVVAL